MYLVQKSTRIGKKTMEIETFFSKRGSIMYYGILINRSM